MRCSTNVSRTVLALLLAVPTSGAAFAAMPLSAVGALHQYCAELDATTHPGLVVLEQPVMTDELATFGGTAFVAQYSGAAPAPGRASENRAREVKLVHQSDRAVPDLSQPPPASPLSIPASPSVTDASDS